MKPGHAHCNPIFDSRIARHDTHDVVYEPSQVHRPRQLQRGLLDTGFCELLQLPVRGSAAGVRHREALTCSVLRRSFVSEY